MSDVNFFCPECKGSLVIDDRGAGFVVQCPHCSKAIPVPTRDHAQSLAEVPTSAWRSGSNVRIVTSDKFAHRGLWIGVAVIVAISICVISFYAFSPRRQEQARAGYIDQLLFGAGRGEIQAKPVLRETPLIVPSATNIDANLVFLRYVEFLASSWPTPSGDSDPSEKQLAAFRAKITKAQEYAVGAGLDSELVAVLKSQQSLYEDYIEMVHDRNRIDEDALTRADTEAAQSSFNAGSAGGQVTVDAVDNGVGFAGSALLGLGTYALNMYLQESQQSVAREQDYNQSVRAEDAKLQPEIEGYKSLFQQTAQTLEHRHGWRAGETGCDVPLSHIEQEEDAVQKKNWAKLAALLDTECLLRTRDPFLYENSAYWDIASRGESISANEYSDAIKKLQLAISYVPKDAFYDEFRAGCYYEAGLYSLYRTASALGGYKKGYAAGPSDATHALRFFLACRKYDLYDSTGWCRRELGHAYAYEGRFDQALALLEEVAPLFSDDKDFVYNLARVYSAAREYDKAWQSFRKSVELCAYSDIKWAKEDPDLAEVRQRYASQFTELTTPKTQAQIDWGIVNDDLILRNDGPFELTNVRFTPRIISKGATYTMELTVASIPPGQGMKWADIFSIPGSTYDSFTYTVASDQGSITDQGSVSTQ